MSLLRSLLFVPGNHQRRMQKAPQAGADAVIVDLEDAVPLSEKAACRDSVREYIGTQAADRMQLLVRINGLKTPFAVDDIDAIAVDGLQGVLLPKAESAGDVQVVDVLLSHWERVRSLSGRPIEILPIIETAVGLQNIAEIAAGSQRIKRLNFGSGDFSLDTGMTWLRGNPGLLAARIRIVFASRAARLEAPLDTVFPYLDDEDGLVSEAREARLIGYQGKMCIHPRQVLAINAIFTPTSEEIAMAQDIVEAFGKAERLGSAAIVVKGLFVDYPVVEKARRIIQAASEAGLM